MGGISGGKQKSSLQTQQFAGLFGPDAGLYEPGARIGANLESILGQGLQLPGGASSVYSDPLQQALLNPQFGPTTSSEQNLLASIMDQVAGRSSVRGLGPPTSEGLAQTIAPTLVNLQQQRVGNLQQALTGDVGSQVAQRGQTIEGMLGGRGQSIQGLLELAGLAMPQVVAGQKTRGKGGSFNFQPPSGAGAAGAAGAA